MEKTGLVKFDAARVAIAKAVSVDEVKDIRDQAEAARKYAQQAGFGLEMQNKCSEIKLRAERRAGQILKKMELRGGDRKSKSKSRDVTLIDLGVTKSQSSRWQLEADVPDEEFEAHIENVTGANKELTSAGVIRLAKDIDREERKSDSQRRGAATANSSHPFERQKCLFFVLTNSAVEVE